MAGSPTEALPSSTTLLQIDDGNIILSTAILIQSHFRRPVTTSFAITGAPDTFRYARARIIHNNTLAFFGITIPHIRTTMYTPADNAKPKKPPPSDDTHSNNSQHSFLFRAKEKARTAKRLSRGLFGSTTALMGDHLQQMAEVAHTLFAKASEFTPCPNRRSNLSRQAPP